jgi:hypothetical protein
MINDPSRYPGLAICIGAVAADQLSVDQAYQKWKQLYPKEFCSCGDNAWMDFRMAVSQRVGRGCAIYYDKRRRRGVSSV